MIRMSDGASGHPITRLQTPLFVLWPYCTQPRKASIFGTAYRPRHLIDWCCQKLVRCTAAVTIHNNACNCTMAVSRQFSNRGTLILRRKTWHIEQIFVTMLSLGGGCFLSGHLWYINTVPLRAWRLCLKRSLCSQPPESSPSSVQCLCAWMRAGIKYNSTFQTSLGELMVSCHPAWLPIYL